MRSQLSETAVSSDQIALTDSGHLDHLSQLSRGSFARVDVLKLQIGAILISNSGYPEPYNVVTSWCNLCGRLSRMRSH